MNEDKFTGKAKTYASFRPSYPAALTDLLYDNYISPRSTIADIGSGTGKLSALLLERGNTVYCVEPNPDMQEEAVKRLFSYGNFIPVTASAENTTLPDASVELITAAQSFHWFDRQKFASECKRIGKEGCHVALIWNSYDASRNEIKELERINGECCPSFKGFAGGCAPQNGIDGFFEEYKTFRFTTLYEYVIDAFIGRCLSSSYSPLRGTRECDNYIEKITHFFNKYAVDGVISLPVITVCHAGTLK